MLDANIVHGLRGIVSLSRTLPQAWLSFFKLIRTHQPERRMPTPRIVEPFDVIKHVCTDFVPGGVLPAVQALAFDRREEALDRRVVPAVPRLLPAM